MTAVISDQQDAEEYLKAIFRSQHGRRSDQDIDWPKKTGNWNKSYFWYELKHIVIKDDVIFRDITFNNYDLSGLVAMNVDFISCSFYRTSFTESVLDNVEFNDCEMREARFSGSELNHVEIKDCNLTGAIFDEAIFNGGCLSGCDLSGAVFHKAQDNGIVSMAASKLFHADFSGAKGFYDPVKWLENNFLTCNHGWLVYKRIHRTNYDPPSYWVIKPGSVLLEIANPDHASECACGVNFGTMIGIDRLYSVRYGVWLCLIPWKQAASIVVPLGATYKARCNHLELVKPLSTTEATAILSWERGRKDNTINVPDMSQHPLAEIAEEIGGIQ